jgi:GNAT superfamily N-acetyltransferase
MGYGQLQQEQLIFADLALARRLERAEAAKYADYAHARTAVVPELNPAVLPVGGGLAVYAGANSPYSRAVGLGLDGPVPEAEFRRYEQFYLGYDLPPQLTVCPLADRSLLELTNRHGYRIHMFMNVWWRRIGPMDFFAPSQPGIAVRPIRPDEADLWVRTAFQGGLDSDDAQPDRTAIIAAYPYMAHAVCYLAWVDSQPAGAGTLAMHEGIAELFGASTRPRFRGGGVQTALLAARLADAARVGCDLATVHTEPGAASQRNVERFGFRLAYTKLMMRRE